MALLGGIRADRIIEQVIRAGALESKAGRQALARLRAVDREAIPRIMERLSTSRYEESDLLVGLLARLAGRNNLELFFAGLTDADPRITQGVVRALKTARELDPNQLLELLGDPKYSRPAVLELLSAHKARLSPDRLLRYASLLEHSELTMLFRIIADRVDASMLGMLIERIDAKDPVLRAQIASVIARFDTGEVRKTLAAMLRDSNKNVRLAALKGLMEMAVPPDVQELCRLLKDPDMSIRNLAGDALVAQHHPRTVYYLLDPLQDESEHARRAAVEVLNEIGDERAVKDLLLAIKDKDWWVRSRAADALGDIGGERVVNSVLKLIRDPDEFIRRTAIEIINATHDERTFDSLVEALGDSDWWVRERAIDGLGALGNQRAVPVLVGLLARHANDVQTGEIVIRALTRLGGAEALGAVLKQLRSPSAELRRLALSSLADMTDDANLPWVIDEVSTATASGSEETQALAREVLAGLRRREAAEPGGAAAEYSDAHSEPGEDARVGTVVMSSTVSRGATALTGREVDLAALRENDILAERYRYIRKVGKGAFGSVLLMEDLMVNEMLILKFLNAQLLSDESIIKRFVYELRFARKITHPNVIRIYDMIQFGSSPAIAMEYFPSHTLSTEISGSSGMDPERGLKLLQDICAGMACAHEAQVIHRDLKPGNILIDSHDLVKIVDFGVAAASSQMDTRLTRTGLLIGTPTYMAPEQVTGRAVDQRTDIYSLGVIMYEMFTGSAPYKDGDSMSIMYQHVRGEAKSPSALNSSIPAVLDALILKAMATEPERRFASMNHLREELVALETRV